MANTSPVRIAQLSDTHFVEDGAGAEGGFGYDTGEAFDAVFDHMRGLPDLDMASLDMIVVTGDVADHGRPAQYRRAANAFSRFDVPVNVCPGNHDQDATFSAGMGRPTVSTSRVVEAGAWCFVFVDSNAGVMQVDASGRSVDPADIDDRLNRNGSLGDREAAWIRDMHATTDADHVFVWVHHPPDAPVGLTADAAYAAEWRSLIGGLHRVRGFGGGHTHVPLDYHFEGLPAFVCPALKNNFDLEAGTMLPPGYRSYAFADDGTITSEIHVVDDPRWPRHRLGRAVMSLLRGELTYAEFDAIVERKRLG